MGSQGNVVPPPIHVAFLRLLSQETDSLSSLRYLATVLRLVTDPKFLTVPCRTALSFIL
jgi:hypothetical protein